MTAILATAIILLNIFAIGSWRNAYRAEEEEMSTENAEWRKILELYHQTHKFPRRNQSTNKTAA